MYFVIFLVTLGYLLYQWNKKPKNFPPGPPTLPLLGSLPFIESKNFHLTLEKLKGKYGPVIGFKFATLPAVGVCGPEEVFEVLKSEEFAGRPIINENNSNKGIFLGFGEAWKVQRRFAHRHLRDFGFGKTSVNDMVMAEVDEFCAEKLKGNTLIQSNGLFNLSAINILWAMISGSRLSYNDKNLQNLFLLVEKRFRIGNPTGGFLNAFPVLRKFISRFHKFEDDVIEEELMEFYKVEIQKHRATRTGVPRDLMDVYLAELENPNKHDSFQEVVMLEIIHDFFGAGTESSGNTLSFALLYLLRHPDWQEKVIEEIDQVLGTKTPTYEDRLNLPITQAFLEETVRCNTIAPLAVPHAPLRDTTLAGYSIPAGTMVQVSLWALLQDKKHWGDPENFRPERFLDQQGKFIRDPYMLVFGTGPRVCVGESLARSFVFIFFVSIMQRYRFLKPEGDPLPDTDCLPGFTVAPKPFNIRLEAR